MFLSVAFNFSVRAMISLLIFCDALAYSPSDQITGKTAHVGIVKQIKGGCNMFSLTIRIPTLKRNEWESFDQSQPAVQKLFSNLKMASEHSMMIFYQQIFSTPLWNLCSSVSLITTDASQTEVQTCSLFKWGSRVSSDRAKCSFTAYTGLAKCAFLWIPAGTSLPPP